ncbi:MAG: hypothetical protein LC754_01965 [Acidobacteria bacterium]|nr:hypothetical protein [Acidobacteriota bacterium]
MTKLRTFILSILILALVASGLPITDTLARWARRSSASSHQRRRHHHSRAWWRRHRARMRARRERAMLLRSVRPSGSTADAPVLANSLLSPSAARKAFLPVAARGPQLPFGLVAPHAWSGTRVAQSGEVRFNVNAPDGRAAGVAVFAPVSVQPADASTLISARTKLIGGTSVSALRRTVIDRMVAEGGWVVNDAVREIQGRKVLVVLAQTGTPGAPSKSLTFYFTELDGRIYSLATTAPLEFAEPIAAGSEQVMASLRSTASRTVAAQK